MCIVINQSKTHNTVADPPSLTEFFFFYYLFESKILASAGSPIITQLVDLFLMESHSILPLI